LVFGQVYPSPTKPDHPPAGLGELATVAAASPVPVLAIGGIAPGTVRAVLTAGARGVAVIGAVAGAADPEAAVRDLQAALVAAPQQAKPKVR
jgi:thiamine-phosphate diphosphorylase